MADIFISLTNDVVQLVQSLEAVLALYGAYCVYRYFGKKK